MPNFTAQIFGSAISALASQQAVIANASNNIANVNTDGYSRRILNLQTRVSGAGSTNLTIGSGVEIASLSHMSDAFLNSLMREATSALRGFETQDQFLDRVESLFSLSGDLNTIGSAVTEFFGSLDTLATNPASLELRSDVMERADDLVSAIQTTFTTIASLQTEADQRLTSEIDVLNTLTTQIAELNGIISQREATGNIAADERDQRALLLDKLSEKIDVEMFENADGAVTIYLPSGFNLVSGITSRDLELSTSPSFNVGNMPPSLDGGILSHVVYDYDPGAGAAHIDLTQELQGAGGIIGGLLTMRGFNDTANTSAFQADGALTEVATRVEAITQSLLTTFNLMNLGPDRDGVAAGHQASSGDLNGNSPGAYGFFTFQFAGARDTDGLGTPDDLGTHVGVDNYSSILQLAISDPAEIAAALDQSAGPPAAASFPQGDASNITGMTGHGFLADHNGLSSLQFANLNFTVTNSTFTRTANFNELYNDTVGRVGNLKARSAVNASVSEERYLTARAQRDEFSGVSLDEEFTSLVRFQKAFEANARMIRTATELLDVIVSLV